MKKSTTGKPEKTCNTELDKLIAKYHGRNDGTKIPLDQRLADFGLSIGISTKSILAMAYNFASSVVAYPDCVKRFSKTYPYMSPNRWERLRLIGNDTVNVRAWYLSDRTFLAFLRRPEKSRNAILDGIGGTVPVVGPSGRVRNVSVDNISESQLSRAQNPRSGRFRTVEEQAAAYKDDEKKSSDLKSAAVIPYEIFDDKIVHIHRQCKISRRELKRMLVALCGSKCKAAEYILSEDGDDE